MFCLRPACVALLKYLTAPCEFIFVVVVLFLCICVCLSPPPDTPTTLPPSTTPPLHPIPPDPTAQLGTHASDPTVTGNRGTVPRHSAPQPPQHATVYSHFPLTFHCPITSLSATPQP